ncbi:hypothetical protein Y032_0256g372 [Ancylostoma ceylanicum]|uniref:Uncharacterized protein n=1 Tax=Ancylostoma ceylanicum TaxID=53326 RepID=A0A016SBT3_9BILA|nr:hypothetical protein Y032_0256g372 [Ancylostoma ceylanicum]
MMQRIFFIISLIFSGPKHTLRTTPALATLPTPPVSGFPNVPKKIDVLLSSLSGRSPPSEPVGFPVSCYYSTLTTCDTDCQTHSCPKSSFIRWAGSLKKSRTAKLFVMLNRVVE